LHPQSGHCQREEERDEHEQRQLRYCVHGVALFSNLFLSVYLNVSFCGFVGVVSRMSRVSPRRMRVVRGRFVMSSLVMFCCFVMMVSDVRTMFRCLSVVLGCVF
jgi:hypothetical protein